MTGSNPIPELTCDEVRELAGAFVLGALEPVDDAAVRAHLVSCSDAHAEIAELGAVLPGLAASVPTAEPPEGLKARIMAAAAADLATRQAAAGAATPAAAPTVAAGRTGAVPAPEPTPFPTVTERTARRSRGSALSWVLGIAAVLAIVALGGWNLLLQNQLNAATAYERSVAQVLEVAAQPGSKAAILTPDGGTGAGLAAVSAAGDVTLAMHDLAPTTGGTVYETWAIGSDGVPIPLGSFTVGSDGTASFNADGVPSSDQVVLALTREPGPGAQTPTMPIISKGVATTAG